MYADPPEGERTHASEYFEAMAAFAQQTLDRSGYPPCPGGWMASNPRWRMPLAAWQAMFKQWIEEAEYRSVEDALILLDMRPVAGDVTLYERLAASIADQLKGASFFKSILGAFRSAVSHRWDSFAHSFWTAAASTKKNST